MSNNICKKILYADNIMVYSFSVHYFAENTRTKGNIKKP